MKSIVFMLLFPIASKAVAQTPEQKLSALKIELPAVGNPVGNYVDAVRVGNLIFLSGKGPRNNKGEYIQGKLGRELNIEQGYAAARACAILQIAVLKKELGELQKLKRIIKVNGYVNSMDSFYDQPKVINGFSDLLVEVFGNAGKHARTALGTNALPFNMAVEVEMVVEVEL